MIKTHKASCKIHLIHRSIFKVSFCASHKKRFTNILTINFAKEKKITMKTHKVSSKS
jgi:hypothetical protein